MRGHGRPSIHLVRALALTTCILTAAACSDDGGGEPPAFFEIDSAGVMVATSTAPAWGARGQRDGEPWTVDPTPLLDLTTTGTGPHHEFFRVADALTLPDGRIVVGDGGQNQVRVYSEGGVFLEMTGQEGEGPGEYRQIDGLARLPGDSLLVLSFPDRATVLAPDLTHVRTFRLPAGAFDTSYLGKGLLVARSLGMGVQSDTWETGAFRTPEPVVTISLADGRVVDTLTVLAGSEEYRAGDGQARASMGMFFGRSSTLAARDGRLHAGDSDSLAYRVLGADGQLLGIVRVPGYDLSVPPGAVEFRRDSLMRSARRDYHREAYRSMPTPAARPAYTEFILDAEGNLWAGGHQDRFTWLDPRPWVVFDPDGRWLGTVTTPARFTVFEIGHDRLLGLAYDDLDVQHVQVLRLTR